MSDEAMSAAAGSSESDKDDVAAVEAAAEARMASIHRGFAAAKAKGIPAATRLMKELRQARKTCHAHLWKVPGTGVLGLHGPSVAHSSGHQVCLAGTFEVDLVDDNLLLWEVTLFDWVFDPSSALHCDLAAISSAKSDLMAVTLRMHFPHDFPCVLRTAAGASPFAPHSHPPRFAMRALSGSRAPPAPAPRFAPPLVYIAQPVLRSDYVFDGALCMEMLVDWQPQYGEALIKARASFKAQALLAASVR
jgi:hypothetical protein